MGEGPVRVAVVNDYEIVVVGIAGVLAPYAERVAVVELDSGLPVATEVDLVLYDSFGQPQGEALDVRSILGSSGARLVVFSWNTQPELVEQSMRAGASGYVSKGVSGAELVAALERVHAGETVTPQAEADSDGAFGHWPGDAEGLSPREAEVLALLCQGLSNQEIGERAFLGLNTVKSYLRTLYRKIDADSRTRAVLWGIDHGFRPDRVRHRVERDRPEH
ncbi:LuxR C-terminal-related transcriptional regulator [Nocardioides coralli]|uniref:LuxR C-terminal-related transcriptional regulator n=1 Tax=Nocardioides coralli TaxID=2872154 RepID=UPI001CA3E084|nr:response regulator transcription factor [Nocardioides coralli]QZY29283.1 response regulator transcription factor [Nocardioides coralli]